MPSYPHLTYDATVDAVAIDLAPTPKGAARVTRELAPGIRADFAGPLLLGFEILGASERIPRRTLERMGPAIVWLTMAEAVKESRRQPRTIRSAIAAGKLEATKRGRDWMIPQHGLWNYLEALGPAGRPTRDTSAPRRRRPVKGAA